MNRLIFCDIDGTILDGIRGMYNVSFKTRYAINELIKNGDYVFIASGRNKGLLTEDIKSLNPSGYILCNGAYAEINNEPLYGMTFSKQAIDAIKQIPEKYDGFYILETVEDMHIYSFENKTFKYFMDSWGLDPKGFIEDKVLNKDFYIAMIGFLDDESGFKATEKIRKFADIAKHKTFTSYDINVKGINKAMGVKRIIDHLNIPFENTYCFGDALNDLEMLQAVYHPVIVENAHAALKEYDFERTDDVLDDGFYNYLVSNKLIKAI